jgi:hypothetical protein
MLLDALPDLAYRDNLQTASLMAAVLNMMGGKADPDDPEAKTVPPERMFTAEDVLVHFAKRPTVSDWTPEAARAALEARDELPAWARESLPWHEINAHAAR